MGNILGTMATGRTWIAMDAHIDTVGVGNRNNWTFDFYQGMEDDELIGGRGASDQEGGAWPRWSNGRIIKDLGPRAKYTLLVTGTVQEEDCDGLCWQYLIEQMKIRPEFVISTEPTDCNIYRGQRGRMEIRIDVQGRSCHGSAPERGETRSSDGADPARAAAAIRAWATTSSSARARSPSRRSSSPRPAAARWLTAAPSRSTGASRRARPGKALDEIRALPAVKAANAAVSMYQYDRPSYTGLVYPTECFFPTWKTAEDHIAVRTLVQAYEGLFKTRPLVDKWTSRPNGVDHGPPRHPGVGFGPQKARRTRPTRRPGRPIS